jgi:hypothetical protein
LIGSIVFFVFFFREEGRSRVVSGGFMCVSVFSFFVFFFFFYVCWCFFFVFGGGGGGLLWVDSYMHLSLWFMTCACTYTCSLAKIVFYILVAVVMI